MRTIKFRGLRTDGKGWVYGFYQYTIYSKAYQKDLNMSQDDGYYIYPAHIDSTPKEVLKESVGQFTGHKDKNGIEIYEGDIISIYRGKRVVEYTPSDGIKLAIIYDEPLKGIRQTHEDFRYNSTCISSVIGNIHENPELLNP